MKQEDKTGKSLPLFRPENISRNLLHLLFIYTLLDLLASLLGIAILFIVQGILMTSLRLAPFWKPAYNLNALLSGNPVIKTEFHPLSRPWWHIPFLVIMISLGLFLIGLGIWVLSNNGFWEQNLIYLWLKHN